VAFLLVIVKAIIEIAGMALLGQFLVGIFAWGRREGNVVYRVFQTVTGPFTWIARKVSPRVVLDQHIPLVTFLLLLFAWVFVVFQLRASCLAEPQQQACPPLQQAR
jgi:hypothetical protein